MKRLLIALALCLVLSPVAEAKKVTIISSSWTTTDKVQTSQADPESGMVTCSYMFEGTTYVSAHVRPGMTISLRVIYGDTTEQLYHVDSWREINLNTSFRRPKFDVVGPVGTEWILAWTVESLKGKNERLHISDAIDVASGTCQ